jgi:hypothetical protein
MAMAEQKRRNAAKQNAPLSATKTRTQTEQDLFVWTGKAEDEDKAEDNIAFLNDNNNNSIK